MTSEPPPPPPHQQGYAIYIGLEMAGLGLTQKATRIEAALNAMQIEAVRAADFFFDVDDTPFTRFDVFAVVHTDHAEKAVALVETALAAAGIRPGDCNIGPYARTRPL